MYSSSRILMCCAKLSEIQVCFLADTKKEAAKPCIRLKTGRLESFLDFTAEIKRKLLYVAFHAIIH